MQLTIISDVTEAVKAKRAYTHEHIEQALQVINLPTHPSFSPTLAGSGYFAAWLSIYRQLIDVEPGSIYDLCGLNATMVSELELTGVRQLVDIPGDFSLTATQSLQVQATRQGSPIIHKDKIKEFLDNLVFPLYFFDYETLASIVPYFDGMKPYKQYPFQYSLHILDAPDAVLRHKEYLHRDNSNPAETLSRTLKSQIGDSGSVVTWNMGFERGCNTLVGSMVPEYTQFYKDLNKRIVDLKTPFSSCWYVDKDFRGSASLKNVLPVVVPELSYKILGIQEGNSAQRLWMEAVLDGKRVGEREQILSDLIEYCKLDTLAMVEIYKKLLAI